MSVNTEKHSALRDVWNYISQLSKQTDFWRGQALFWGLLLVTAIAGGLLFTVLALSGVRGGGSITYAAVGSPGPVHFNHATHMAAVNRKYQECKSCHNKLFATQKYGSFVLRALHDSPPRKVVIGKDASTMVVQRDVDLLNTAALVTYEAPRACATCATGVCHDGKESFGRFECLKCHKSY